MSFQLVPKSVTLNDLERRIMAVTLRFFTKFGKPAFLHITPFARRKERSRWLSHLLMSFLFDLLRSNCKAIQFARMQIRH